MIQANEEYSTEHRINEEKSTMKNNRKVKTETIEVTFENINHSGTKMTNLLTVTETSTVADAKDTPTAKDAMETSEKNY